jgi:hypothetical protein
MKENSGINMATSKKDLSLEKLPTLSDVILVEKILQDANESIITMAKLEKLLHKKINKNILSIILDYLEEENKIAVTSRGITWIKNKRKLLELFDKLLEKSELTEEDAILFGKQITKKAAQKFRDA